MTGANFDDNGAPVVSEIKLSYIYITDPERSTTASPATIFSSKITATTRDGLIVALFVSPLPIYAPHCVSALTSRCRPDS